MAADEMGRETHKGGFMQTGLDFYVCAHVVAQFRAFMCAAEDQIPEANGPFYHLRDSACHTWGKESEESYFHIRSLDKYILALRCSAQASPLQQDEFRSTM